MKAPTEKPPQGKKSCISVGGFIYAWADDGDQANISCDEWVKRDSSVWTVCVPVGNHVAPPNGGNDWLIETEGTIKIIVSANGDNHEDFSRSLSGTVTCQLPTGRTVQVTHEIVDNPQHNQETVHVVVGGDISEAKEAEIEADVKKNVAARLKRAQSIGGTATISVTSTSKWKSNESISHTQTVPFNDKMLLQTFCHENQASFVEKVDVSATGEVTAPGSSDDLYVQGYYYGEICTTVQSRIWRYCGEEKPVAYEADWAALAKGDQVKAGSIEPHNPIEKDADNNGDGGAAAPTGQKGTSLPQGEQGHSIVQVNFEVEIPEAGEQRFFVRMHPDAAGDAAEIESVTAKAYDGSGEITFVQDSGVFSGELTGRVWSVVVDVIVYGAATFYVEGCFTSDFEEGATTRSVVDAVPHFLTPAKWAYGVHNAVSSASPVIHLDTSVQTVVDLDCFATDSESLDGVVATWQLPNGENITWTAEPELVYNEDMDRWYIVLCPDEPVEVDFYITLAGGQTILVPIHCEVGG